MNNSVSCVIGNKSLIARRLILSGVYHGHSYYGEMSIIANMVLRRPEIASGQITLIYSIVFSTKIAL